MVGADEMASIGEEELGMFRLSPFLPTCPSRCPEVAILDSPLALK